MLQAISGALEDLKRSGLPREAVCKVGGHLLEAADAYADTTKTPWDDYIVMALKALHASYCDGEGEAERPSAEARAAAIERGRGMRAAAMSLPGLPVPSDSDPDPNPNPGGDE